MSEFSLFYYGYENVFSFIFSFTVSGEYSLLKLSLGFKVNLFDGIY